MDSELIIKAISKLYNTFDYDDCTEYTKVFAKCIHKLIQKAVNNMPYGACYLFDEDDMNTYTLKGIYKDNNITLKVKIPIDCTCVNVNQIVSAHATEGYVFTIETIQRTQQELKEVITDVILPISEVIKGLDINNK